MRTGVLIPAAVLALGLSAGSLLYRDVLESRGSVPPSPAATAVHVAPEAQPRVSRPARIYVPRLHLASRVFPSSELSRGPAWWPVTGRPGGGDTVAIAGHRTTHTRPFYYLDRLRRGDRVIIAWRGQTTVYRVTGQRVLPAGDLHMADAVGHERLLLSACTPRGSAAYRLVVYAQPLLSS